MKMRVNKKVWEERANISQRKLGMIFWDSKENVYKPFTPYYQEEIKAFHYWWQAHAIDVLLDGFERTNDNKFIDKIDLLIEGVYGKNNQQITNDFYDDMEWMALALLRGYKLTGKTRYLQIAEELWDDIMTGWNDYCGGGFAWQKKQLYYKNTPANAPAIILAFRLYQEKKDSRFLKQAEETFSWLENNLVDPETGFIWDGMNRENDMEIDKDWEFTYCQGVFVGACVEYYKVTNEEKYLVQAKETIKAAFDRLVGEDGKILISEGVGDGGLFKGIFIRYVEEFLQHDPDKEIIDLILENGEQAWKTTQSSPENLFGENWSIDNKESSITLSTHLSGCMLMEGVYRLQN